MDVIEYKLGTNNPTLISHAIWKLLDAVKQKVENGENESKIPELKYLLNQCESSNGLISITACQALVALAESGILTVNSSLSNLTACLGTAKHCGAVASAICNLLTLDLKISKPEGKYECPFTLKNPQHPLITVLKQKKDAWRDVLSHALTMMNHCKTELVDHHVALLRPLFLYILCDPELSLSESCRQPAWHSLIRTNGTIDLQIEILQWLRTCSLESCIEANNRILEIAEMADACRDKALCTILAPLVMSMALELVRHNGDPRANLDMIAAILVHASGDFGSVLICLLAEIITICPSVYLLDIVTTGKTIIDKTSCDRKIAHVLIAAILPWMAYPSILSTDALNIGKRLIEKIINEPWKNCEAPENFESPYYRILQVDANLQFYTELCTSVDLWNAKVLVDWLDRLSRSPNYVLSNYKLVVAGILLESDDTRVIEKSIEILVDCRKNHGQILPLILHKLSNTRDIDQTKILLFALPKFTRSKENVPIVMNTLKTLLSAGKPLNYLAVELYVRAMSVEPRCHRYLQTALVELSDNDNTWQAEVTCARAMKYVCEKHPEHGAELVPLLSQTLNRCLKRGLSAASALSLNGISALCVAGVIEISSTWRVLAPKMNNEERSIVVRAICEFFGDIPQNPPQENDEYEKFVVQVLTKLWDYALNSRKNDINEAAFKALASYKLSIMPLSVLPVQFRHHVEVPRSIVDDIQNDDDDEKTDNNLSYIPADYWIPLLKYVNPSSIKLVGDFLRNSIKEELYSFRTGIYRWPHGEPGNFKYLSEKSPLREIGEYIRHYRPNVDDDEADKKRVTVECMRIFSYKYPKALPPIKWENFLPALSISSETRRYGLSLSCHQAPISPSAKEYVEKYLTNFAKKCSNHSIEEFKECMLIYEKLDDVCRAVGSNFLGPFLDASLNYLLEKNNRDNETVATIFDEIMGFFAIALKDELIQNDNRSLLTSTLEKLMDRIDVDGRIFKSYTNAALELTAEQLERMTLPSVWLDVTMDKLKKAIVIRAELVLRKNDATPLTWMNEIIRASASIPAVHACLLEEMQRILPQMRLDKSNANWTLDLMRRIGSIMVDCKNDNIIDTAVFLCEILFITVICLSSTDCLLLHDRFLVTSSETRRKLFPQALASIVQTAFWKDIVTQTMEWLSHMRTTAIPRTYKIVFHNALVSLKNEGYFDVMWTKYLSVRAPINA